MHRFYYGILTLFILTALNAKGLCLGWSSGDAIHLDFCKVTTKEKCVANSTKFEGYAFAAAMAKAPVYKNAKGLLVEYRQSNETCRSIQIEVARNIEDTMSYQWGSWSYASEIKEGDQVYLYGKKIKIFDKPSFHAKLLAVGENGQQASIVTKQNKSETHEALSAYWYEITMDNQRGWVWGRYLHPNPFSIEPM